MTREEVQERFDTFLALLDREQELKEELLRLKLRGTRDEKDQIAERVARHDELIQAIEELRHREMLPILEDLAAFIGSRGFDRVE